LGERTTYEGKEKGGKKKKVESDGGPKGSRRGFHRHEWSVQKKKNPTNPLQGEKENPEGSPAMAFTMARGLLGVEEAGNGGK